MVLLSLSVVEVDECLDVDPDAFDGGVYGFLKPEPSTSCWSFSMDWSDEEAVSEFVR